MSTPRSRWLAVVAGLLTVAATLALGGWQLGRAAEKQAAAALIAQRARQQAWGDADWPCAAPGLPSGTVAAAPGALPEHRPVRLHGHWLGERTVFLDNRPMDGAPGFDVVTPLRLSRGPCAGRLLLVQRGWLPRDAADRQRLPRWRDTADEVSIPGRVLLQLSRTYALGHEALPSPGQLRPIRQNTDAAFWQHWLGQAPLAGALLQTDDDAAAAAMGVRLRRHWAAADSGVGKHQAYAAQWFAMSAVAAGLTLWFQFIRPWLRRSGQAAHAARP